MGHPVANSSINETIPTTQTSTMILRIDLTDEEVSLLNSVEEPQLTVLLENIISSAITNERQMTIVNHY